MSIDGSGPADGGRPPPAPVSDAIARHAHHMGGAVRRAEAVGRPRIAQPSPPLVPDRPPLARLGPDPAAEMSRLKLDTERPVQRPRDTDEQLRVRTPQFFLRNTMRLERYGDPDWIETIRRPVRDMGHWADLEAAARCFVERFDPAPDSASTRLVMLLAERKAVMVETRWHEVFGRPDTLLTDEPQP